MMRSSIFSRSGEDCIMTVTSFSAYTCDLTLNTVCFPGCIRMFIGCK